MSDSNILTSMRSMSFERAIGELKAALDTYYGQDKEFSESAEALREFEEKCRDDGLFGQ